jgi:hypothetical protein
MTKTSDEIPLTPEAGLDPSFAALCKSITAKRARTVIDHILRHGIITNEDLSSTYGYDHPPRAIRDVRENGIPLITHKVISKATGRKIGAYTFDDPSRIKHGRIGGRKAFSKQFKEELITRYGARDAFTNELLDARYLQIDHRIPYQVIGDADAADNVSEFMLIDGSSQRAKSWSCEHCKNWLELSDPEICRRCFWAFPEDYDHLAMDPVRRVDLMWQGDSVAEFDGIRREAEKRNLSVQTYIKALLSKARS